MIIFNSDAGDCDTSINAYAFPISRGVPVRLMIKQNTLAMSQRAPYHSSHLSLKKYPDRKLYFIDRSYLFPLQSSPPVTISFKFNLFINDSNLLQIYIKFHKSSSSKGI